MKKFLTQKRGLVFIGIVLFGVLFGYILAKVLIMIAPWTEREAFNVLENGGTREEIVLTLDYLGDSGNPEYVVYLMDYIDDCNRVGNMNRRNYIIKFPTPISYIAGRELTQITTLDFGYDILKDCEDPQNQAAIQAWKDWYENDYEAWREEQLPDLT